MKRVFIIAFITAVIFTVSSCLKEKHQIRFKNDYAVTIINAGAGTARFGAVPVNKSSDYQSINTGTFTIYGSTSSGQLITGSGTVSGKGSHKWTLTIDAAGQVGITKDK